VKAKKIIVLALVAVLVLYIVTQPSDAGEKARMIAGGLRDAADAIVTFVISLFT
jgi:hypothetical protein